MATETSSTSKKFLYVDSADYSAPSGTNVSTMESVFDIRLTDPIHDVTSVSLVSYTLPNELYNVTQYNQRAYVAAWTGSMISPADVFEMTIPIGFYTLDKLVEAVNTQLTALTFINDSTKLRPTLEYVDHTNMTNGKRVKFSVANTGVPNSESRNKFALLCDHHTEPFKYSIWSRLGFTPSQIIQKNNEAGYATIQEIDFTTYNPTGIAWVMGDNTVSTPVSTTVSADVYANHGGYESYESIHVHADLSSGSVFRTLRDPSGGVSTQHQQVLTTRTDLLGVVPITSNLGSMQTWYRPSDSHMTLPTNSRRPIDHIRFTLTNSAGQPFKREWMPGFTLLLEFNVVEHVDAIVEKTRAVAQQRQFLSRHVPMSLD